MLFRKENRVFIERKYRTKTEVYYNLQISSQLLKSKNIFSSSPEASEMGEKNQKYFLSWVSAQQAKIFCPVHNDSYHIIFNMPEATT